MTWTRETVRAELIGILQGHAREAQITESSHLVADLSIDSLGVMEVLADVEDKFGLTIPDEALREVDTVASVAREIETRLLREGRLVG